MKSRVLLESTGGTLKGAYAEPLKGVELPETNGLKPSIVYNVKAPPGKCLPGTQFVRKLHGEEVHLTVPEGFDRLKAGRFKYTHLGDVDKVIATTLPTVPGYEMALAKPIVYGCETQIFDDRGFSGKPTVAKVITKLTQDAQNQVNSLAIEQDCNAVLGMQFNVAMSHPPTTDKTTTLCKVAVTCFGTPCVIVPSANVPQTLSSSSSSSSTTKKTLLYAEGTNVDDRSIHSMATEDPESGTTNLVPANVGDEIQRNVSALGKSPHDEEKTEDELLPAPP